MNEETLHSKKPHQIHGFKFCFTRGNCQKLCQNSIEDKKIKQWFK